MRAAAPSPDRIVELGYAFRSAKALLAAVELGVFTVLAEGPLDREVLRQRLGIEDRGVADFFDALVALRLLRRDRRGLYANTGETDLYLDRRKPTYIGSLLENLNAREYGIWADLAESLRTGRPQTGFEKPRHFGTLYADTKRRDLFVRGMTGATRRVATEIAARFPWTNYHTLIDIGTGEGCLPTEIALAHRHVTGGGFDLPELRPLFDDFVGKHGLSDRLRFHSGDFFDDPLPGADVVVMGRVLHNWELPAKRMLLAKAHEALPAGGALIICERLIDDERRTATAGLLSSLNMLLMTEGGFDFSAADCFDWLRDSGFRDMRVEPLTCAHSMIVAMK